MKEVTRNARIEEALRVILLEGGRVSQDYIDNVHAFIEAHDLEDNLFHWNVENGWAEWPDDEGGE